MSAKYCVEYAASNRAGCRTCKSKIDKGALRIGTTTPGPSGHDQTQWRHLECQKMPKHLGSVEELDNFEVINPADQEKVRAHFTTSTGPSPQKRSREAVAEDSGLDPKKMKTKELKETVAAHGGPTEGSAKELRLVVDEIKQRAALEVKYNALNASALKAMLEANNQLKSGSKPELVDRIIDAKLFGALPKCPKCGGGVLRVNYAVKVGHGGKGKYSCPGYYDDDHYVRCSYTSDSAERIPWQD